MQPRRPRLNRPHALNHTRSRQLCDVPGNEAEAQAGGSQQQLTGVAVVPDKPNTRVRSSKQPHHRGLEMHRGMRLRPIPEKWPCLFSFCDRRSILRSVSEGFGFRVELLSHSLWFSSPSRMKGVNTARFISAQLTKRAGNFSGLTKSTKSTTRVLSVWFQASCS